MKELLMFVCILLIVANIVLGGLVNSFKAQDPVVKVDASTSNKGKAIESDHREKKMKALITTLFSSSSDNSSSSSDQNVKIKPSTSTNKIQPGSRRYKQLEDQKIFKYKWNKEQLGTHLEPEILAQKVIKMREIGVKSKVFSTLATNIVRKKKKLQYEKRYLSELARIGNRLRYNRKVLNQSSFFDSHPQELEEIALEKALNPTYTRYNSHKVATSKYTPYQQAKYDRIAKRGADLLARFQEYLDQKKLNLSTAPPEILEEESRSVRMNVQEKRILYVHLKKYLQKERNVSESQLKEISKNRSYIRNRDNDRLYKARKRQKTGAVD